MKSPAEAVCETDGCSSFKFNLKPGDTLVPAPCPKCGNPLTLRLNDDTEERLQSLREQLEAVHVDLTRIKRVQKAMSPVLNAAHQVVDVWTEKPSKMTPEMGAAAANLAATLFELSRLARMARGDDADDDSEDDSDD